MRARYPVMTEPETTSDAPAAPIPSAAAVDLTELKMMPAWVSGMSGGSTTDFSRYEEREDRGPRRGGFGGDRRDGPPGRRPGGGGGFGDRPRPAGDGQGQRPPRRDGPPGQGGGPRRDGPPGQRRDGPPGPRRDGPPGQGGGPRRFGDRNRADTRPQREWVEMPRDIQVIIEPEDKAAEALATHIRTSGHAFSMFDAARLVLADGDRFHARYVCASERAGGLFATKDGGLFLNREEALQHVMRSSALDAFYRSEEIELEEPKGDFKSIGICGMSGELLGPPSHHSFQSTIIRLHRERFSTLPLEEYKRRVRVETSPERVVEWKEKLKKGHRWVWLLDQPAEGAEPLSLKTRAEMEAHFRRIHGDEAVTEVRDGTVAGNIDKSKLTHVLFIMLRQGVDNARKHLFDMSQKLGSGFERRGLKLFKRRAGKLFVSRVKPKAIDPGVVFSERVARIVEVLKGKAGILLHDLVEAICPSAPVAPAAEGETTAPAKIAPTEEQIGVIKDIRWLANEGYVIEYSDGMVFLGVQGEPQSAPKAPPTPTAKVEASQEAPVAKSAAEAPAQEAATEVTVEEAIAESPAEETPVPAEAVEVETPASEAHVDEAPAESASAELIESMSTDKASE